jgi:methane monooxygenase component A beta chain/propane monooxygenase small subunit
MGTEQFPDTLGGKRDFDYVTPKGRRLTEYEAVTCYTQPSVHGGGLQACGDYLLRPDGRPVFDPASTQLRCDDWFAYRDPNQMWQRPYYVTQSEAEKSIERATEVAVATGSIRTVDAHWLQQGLVGAYFPFAHYEYGLFRALNMTAREALSDTLNNVFIFNAADKLRHAQAISILGLDLETALEGFDGTLGKALWLEDPAWQPLRRLTEQAMAIKDWGETVIAINLVIEPLIGEPLRRLVFALSAARHRDLIVPAIAGTATADWHRNAAASRELVSFLADCPQGEDNRKTVAEWLHTWRDHTLPVACNIFEALETSLREPGLQSAAQTAGGEEIRRVGADQLDAIPSGT